MAIFTTTVQAILKEKTKKETPEEQIEAGKDIIFTNIWTTGNDERDSNLKKKILRHYYFREIGYEVPALWENRLNEELSLIIPMYKPLYDHIDEALEKPFNDVNITETNETNGTTNSTSSSENSGNSTESSSTTNNTTSKTDGTGSGSGDAWQTSNDTPQGGLEGLETNKYLSAATHNKSTSDQKTNSTNSTDGTTEINATGTDSSTSSTTADSNSVTNSTRTLSGKNSGGSYFSNYIELLTKETNIDKMIIEELEPLFMGLWE